MSEKPAHLAPGYGAQFADRSVARAYATRPPYPAELFEVLAALLPTGPRRVLELGCGTGDLTLGLARRVECVDAVEPAEAMLSIARQRTLTGPSNICWVASSAETFTYDGRPYALVVAAESLHWMDWNLVLPAIESALTVDGRLAIVTGRDLGPLPWQLELRELVQRHSTNREYQPYDLVEELTARACFREEGRRVTVPIGFEQSVADYIESFHSRNGFSRERMGSDGAAAFDRALQALLAQHCGDGVVRARLSASVVWGRPRVPG